jgi:glycerol-3-phosphate acyltransferase PlsY
MEFARFISALVASYLCGSIPFAYLIARARGVDIRRVGSGNVGATNVFRTVSRPLGVLVFVLDMAKGYAPALWGARLISDESTSALVQLSCGAAAILGHTWPVWLRFKGGKGVATGAGVLWAVAPSVAALAIVGWILVFAVSRYVSLASIAAALVAAAGSWGFYPARDPRPTAITMLAAIVVMRHRSNIRRLLAGDELRAGARRRTPENASR